MRSFEGFPARIKVKTGADQYSGLQVVQKVQCKRLEAPSSRDVTCDPPLSLVEKQT